MLVAAGPSFAADNYPSRVVTLIDAFPPGGGTDFMARYFAARASEDWGKTVVVENHPGAGGQIGMTAVARAPADGYTMMVLPNAIWLMAPILYKNMPFDINHDLTPIASLARVPVVMTLKPSLPVKTLQEFLDLARKNPGKLTYGSAGVGTVHQLSAELLESMTGIQMVHVPYKGTAPALSDLLAGNIDLMFSPLGAVFPHIKAGELKALAVADTVPTSSLPGVPTIAQAGVPGYAAPLGISIVGPKNLPPEVIAKWEREIQHVMLSDEARKAFLAQGAVPEYVSHADLIKRFAADSVKWHKIVRDAGIAGR